MEFHFVLPCQSKTLACVSRERDSLVSPASLNKRMATGASMVGKHIDVGRPVTYQSESLVASDKAVVITRVIGARASDTTTDLAIVSAGDFDSFKALVVSTGTIDATALGKAKVVLPGVKNAGLSRVFGAARETGRSSSTTRRRLSFRRRRQRSQAAIRWSARGLRPRSRSSSRETSSSSKANGTSCRLTVRANTSSRRS